MLRLPCVDTPRFGRVVQLARWESIMTNTAAGQKVYEIPEQHFKSSRQQADKQPSSYSTYPIGKTYSMIPQLQQVNLACLAAFLPLSKVLPSDNQGLVLVSRQSALWHPFLL